MDSRSILPSFLAFAALALSNAQAQPTAPDAQQAVAHGPSKPWKEVRGVGRVLDFTKLPVVIDEPGRYALQRDWDLTGYQLGGDVIRITANDVTLDLHGFSVGIRLDDIHSTLLAVGGNQVVVRNGRLWACCEGAAAFGSTGSGTRLDHLVVEGQEPMQLEGALATITDSRVYARWGIVVNESSVVRHNALGCRTFCLTLQGDMNQVLDNRFTFGDADSVVEVDGDANVIERNVIDTDMPGPGTWYIVDGDRNVLRDNTVTGSGAGTGFAVGGTGNTLDGNIVASREGGPSAIVGIGFTANGNFYGDNRMAATVPFDLNGTVQKDWGGNVSY